MLYESSILSVSLLSFLSFFAVLTPIKYVVVFLSTTYPYSNKEKKNIANKSMLIAFITLIVSTIFGEYIFKFLQIDLFAFKIAGGLLLTINGVNMTLGQNIETPSTKDINKIKDDISIFPLAIPIITGPGAISTGIILFSNYHSLILKLIVLSSVVANFILLFVSVHLSTMLAKKINTALLNILYRVFGLLVSALAINIFISGIKEAGLFG